MAFYCALICKCERLVDIIKSCRKSNVSLVYRLTQGCFEINCYITQFTL
jgi:hypothetical protein